MSFQSNKFLSIKKPLRFHILEFLEPIEHNLLIKDIFFFKMFKEMGVFELNKKMNEIYLKKIGKSTLLNNNCYKGIIEILIKITQLLRSTQQLEY